MRAAKLRALPNCESSARKLCGLPKRTGFTWGVMRAIKKRGQSEFASDLEFYGGRNRVRTCDPFRVKEVRSRCAIRPDSKRAGKKPAPKFQWLPG